MARVRVMYWKEIPVQVQAEDDSGQVSKPLDARFQQGVDTVSMIDGSGGSDAYLEAWDWGGYSAVAGDADAAAARVAEGYNKGFPMDFVARIIQLQKSGARDTRPGAIDYWRDDDAD